jgi:hypothetical protein
VIFLIMHRHRFPDPGSSASHGRIISQRAITSLKGQEVWTLMRPMLRSADYCIDIMRWIAIADRINTFTEGGVVMVFGDGTQLEVIPVPADAEGPIRMACPLIFMSDWLRMTEDERCAAFNAA